LRTHKHTNPQTSTLSDNKGPLKLSAREPILYSAERILVNRNYDIRYDISIFVPAIADYNL